MMENQYKLTTIRNIYAGLLADAVKHMGEAGVLEQITRKKRAEQLKTGKAKAEQFGIIDPRDVFRSITDLFQCADWMVDDRPGGFYASALHCLLCGFAKKMGAQNPCRIYCLDPFEGMVKGLDPNATFTVMETLYKGKQCRVEVGTSH